MSKADIGVFGLGTMGGALALNLAENGFRVAVANRETDWIAPLIDRAGALGSQFVPAETLETFVGALTVPRVVLFMIPSGRPLDDMIARIVPLLDRGDTIVDAGNADFNDTRRRSAALAAQGLHFVGMGVSGGEQGARHGPSMMVGGTVHGWSRLRPMAEAVAARYEGDPCVAHLGPDGAGHFVKTVHNGIEYADMQMLAEVYGLLRDGAGWPSPRIGTMFADWNKGPLRSYLTEVSARVLQALDPGTGQPMVEVIEDRAGQKGTGRWTVIEALRLGQSPSTIEAAVGARGWSAAKDQRVAAAGLLAGVPATIEIPAEDVLAQAFEAARILAHVQGFSVLKAASEEYGWELDLARIAEIWRAGCIIRSALLDDLAVALRDEAPEGALLLVPALRKRLVRTVPALRQVVGAAVASGLPAPALGAALTWHDAMRQGRSTADLIQAQRDFFGRHGFARTDSDGVHHGPWWGQT